MKTLARDAILDAAERLLDLHGYQRISMEDVAREAGVGRTTIYLHFKTKEEVALSTLDRVHFRLLDRLRTASGGDAPPAERVRSMLRARVTFTLEEARSGRGRGFEGFYAAARPAYLARREQYLENEAGLLADVLEAGRAAGAFRFDDAPRDAALALVFATNGLMAFSLSPRQAGEPEEVLRRADTVIALLLDGLRARPAQPDNYARTIATIAT